MDKKIMSIESLAMVLNEKAWDVYMNFCFQVWYDNKTDTYALSNDYANPVFFATDLSVIQLNDVLESFNPFFAESRLGKSTYTGIVEFTLDSMFELAATDNSYCLLLDLIHYYNCTIVPEKELSADEFLDLVARCARKHKRKGVKK